MKLRPRVHRFQDNTVHVTGPLSAGTGTPQRTGPPAPPPGPPEEPEDAAILGFPAEPDDEVDGAEGDDPHLLRPAATGVLLVVRHRADPAAGVALLLAAAAAVASMWLSWAADGGPSGGSLVRQGLEAGGLAELLSGDLWPPVAVVASGAALLLVGPLPFRPARTHRAAGVLALLATVPAAAGVGVACAGAGWDPSDIGAGLWCAVAVAGLGLLGALKAMLTLPRVTAAG
ncbi:MULTISPECIES: hypothetical protein [unclassified Blastococcus]